MLLLFNIFFWWHLLLSMISFTALGVMPQGPLAGAQKALQTPSKMAVSSCLPIYTQQELVRPALGNSKVSMGLVNRTQKGLQASWTGC